MSYVISALKGLVSGIREVVLRSQFVATLAMFFFIALMVVQDDAGSRALLLLPVIVSYYVAKLLFSMEQKERVDRIIEKLKARNESK